MPGHLVNVRAHSEVNIPQKKQGIQQLSNSALADNIYVDFDNRNQNVTL